jgi:hypothetical protein
VTERVGHLRAVDHGAFVGRPGCRHNDGVIVSDAGRQQSTVQQVGQSGVGPERGGEGGAARPVRGLGQVDVDVVTRRQQQGYDANGTAVEFAEPGEVIELAELVEHGADARVLDVDEGLPNLKVRPGGGDGGHEAGDGGLAGW